MTERTIEDSTSTNMQSLEAPSSAETELSTLQIPAAQTISSRVISKLDELLPRASTWREDSWEIFTQKLEAAVSTERFVRSLSPLERGGSIALSEVGSAYKIPAGKELKALGIAVEYLEARRIDYIPVLNFIASQWHRPGSYDSAPDLKQSHRYFGSSPSTQFIPPQDWLSAKFWIRAGLDNLHRAFHARGSRDNEREKMLQLIDRGYKATGGSLLAATREDLHTVIRELRPLLFDPYQDNDKFSGNLIEKVDHDLENFSYTDEWNSTDGHIAHNERVHLRKKLLNRLLSTYTDAVCIEGSDELKETVIQELYAHAQPTVLSTFMRFAQKIETVTDIPKVPINTSLKVASRLRF